MAAPTAHGFGGTPAMSDWNDFRIEMELPDPAEAFQVPDNGFQLTLLWAAGPEHGFRVPMYHPGFVTVTVQQDGQRRSHHELRTEEDLVTIDETVNAYLDEAGIPARPRGYDWFCAIPAALRGCADPARELFAAVDKELGEAVTGADTLAAARTVAARYFPPS